MRKRPNGGIITINDSGAVNVPTNVQMSEFEIAQLLGIMVPTVRGAIKRLLNSRPFLDCSGGVVRGNRVVPEYFGLEVVIAIAMQFESYEADIFRRWLLRKATRYSNQQPIYIQMNRQDSNFNAQL
ncbi:MAG: hypothetical protein SNH27_12655 [Rikenellaceae bacterium]